MKISWHPSYAHPLPHGHRFPMIKYDLLPEVLIKEGVVAIADLHEPAPITDELILKVHAEDYLKKLNTLSLTPKEQRATGFPLSAELIKREKTIMQGTCDCIDFAFKNGCAMNIAGGTHHAFYNKGEGFCLLNDLAIAASYAIDHYHLKKVLIVDLDVHQGNGTAQIFADDERVFTFSMHGKNNYPLHKENSDLDVALEDQTDDFSYLEKLDNALENIISRFIPELIIYQSGVDILKTDKLGRMALTLEGCAKRDERVFDLAKKLKVPVVAAMGGGYSEDINIIVEAHANTFREGANYCADYFKK